MEWSEGRIAGADGLIIEVHHDLDHALSAGPESPSPQQYAELADPDDRHGAGAEGVDWRR